MCQKHNRAMTIENVIFDSESCVSCRAQEIKFNCLHTHTLIHTDTSPELFPLGCGRAFEPRKF